MGGKQPRAPKSPAPNLFPEPWISEMPPRANLPVFGPHMPVAIARVRAAERRAADAAVRATRERKAPGEWWMAGK